MKLFQVWAATFLGDISQDFAKCGLQLFQVVLILHCSVIGQRQCSLIGPGALSLVTTGLSLVTTGLSLVKLLLVPNYHWSMPVLSHWSQDYAKCSEIQFQVPACNFSRRHW